MNALATFSGGKDGFDTRPASAFRCIGSYIGEHMNYSRIYSEFIADRRSKEHTLVGYTEKHHIVPRSLGGDNSQENLIKLSAEDHVRAHLLLAKIHGGKMWAAITCLLGNRKLYSRTVTRRERLAFSAAKIKSVEYLKERGFPVQCREALQNARKSKTWGPVWSDAQKLKRSELAKQQILEGKSFVGKKGSDNWMTTQKAKDWISKRMSGESNPMLGNHTKKTADHNEKVGQGLKRVYADKKAYAAGIGFVGDYRTLNVLTARAWLETNHNKAA
jgi:hypothetical protein